MTDDDQPPGYSIPSSAIERWASLPDDRELAIPLKRVDLDNLLLAIRGALIAQSFVLSSIAHASRSEADMAKVTYDEAVKHNDAAFLKLNALITAVMNVSFPIGAQDEQ